MNAFLWRLICSVPFLAIIGYSLSKMINIRNMKRYMLLFYLLGIPIACLGTVNESMVEMRPIATFAYLILCTLLFADGKKIRNIFAVVLIYVASAASEIIAGFVTYAAYGDLLSDEYFINEMDKMIIMQILFWVVQSCLCFFVVFFWRKNVNVNKQSQYGRFITVPISQAIITSQCAIYGLMKMDRIDLYFLLVGMAVFFIVIDVILIRKIGEYTDHLAKLERTSILEKRLEEEKIYYDSVIEEMESTSRIRHDLRNQLQTILVLSSEGKTELAAELVDEMTTYVEGIGVKEV